MHLKNHHQERRLLTRRCYTALGIICLLIFVIISRLVYLQIAKNEFYSTLSTQNRIEKVPIEPNRGLIYDRNGVLLARNIPVFSLELSPGKIENLDQTVQELKSLLELSQAEIDRFYKTLKQKRRYEDVPIKIKLTPEEVALFSVSKFRFPGVQIKAGLLREYPQGEHMAHVVGYVGRINAYEAENIDKANYSASNYIGKIGIEKFYEDDLHGKVGYQNIEVDAAGNIIRTTHITPPIPGHNLYLSIDLSLQKTAEKSLGEHQGAIVAIDPNNGDILAMVSQPSFDPNLFVQGISNKKYQALQNDPKHPLYNRTIRGLYAPGSTVKPFIAVKALADEFVTEQDEITDKGYFKLAHSKHIFHDWKRSGHGQVNIHKAIVESSDTYFYWLAYQLKIKNLAPILKSFGFGKPTGIDLNNELSGVAPSSEWKNSRYNQPWYPGDTLNTGIGQGYTLATPLQLATAVATLSMHGQRYQPRLVINNNQEDIPSINSSPIGISTDDQAWDIVTRAMQGVIKEPHGTGFRFGKHAPYSVAGKTGTAQVYTSKQVKIKSNASLPENLRDNGLFIAFAPVDHPQIAIAIITEHTDTLAPIIARKMMDEYLSGQQAKKIATPSSATRNETPSPSSRGAQSTAR